jgi:hypothetical protein
MRRALYQLAKRHGARHSAGLRPILATRLAAAPLMSYTPMMTSEMLIGDDGAREEVKR